MERDNNHKITSTYLLKNRIKTIPLIGFIIRFLNTFIHLNHLKFKVYTQEKCILNLECIVQDQEKRLEDQEKRLEDQEKRLEDQEKRLEDRFLILEDSLAMLKKDIELISKELERTNNIIEQSIASHIYYQLHSVQHRLDLLESKNNASVAQ